MTNEKTLFDDTGLEASPLNEFSGCHEGIIRNFQKLRTLPDLLADQAREQTGAPQLKQLAKQLLEFFKLVVLEHHAEEEEELFTAVMESAEEGEEMRLAQQSIQRLTAEHRELESMWRQLMPDMKRLSKGKTASLDTTLAVKLATQYLAHADYEEQVFLPLSARILDKNQMSALGLSLHMRHQEDESPAHYIV